MTAEQLPSAMGIAVEVPKDVAIEVSTLLMATQLPSDIDSTLEVIEACIQNQFFSGDTFWHGIALEITRRRDERAAKAGS